MPHTLIQKVSASLQNSLADSTIHAPAIKAGSAIAAGGVGLTWNEIAAIAAALYTSLLMFEWLWKKLFSRMWRAWRARKKGQMP